jgi:hypothetical protein
LHAKTTKTDTLTSNSQRNLRINTFLIRIRVEVEFILAEPRSEISEFCVRNVAVSALSDECEGNLGPSLVRLGVAG